MFDKITIMPSQTRMEYVTREVREIRAPTDESVRLLKEMEQAAEAKLIASYQLPGNALSGLLQVFRHDAQAALFGRLVFDLNGARHTVEATVHLYDENAREALIKKLHEATSEAVTALIVSDFLARHPDLRVN